jgi:hypothetical protein
MKRFKKMKFNDLWALIGRSEEFNGYKVNPSCAAIMERMAQKMGRLAVMGAGRASPTAVKSFGVA